MNQPRLEYCGDFCKPGPEGELPLPMIRGQELVQEAQESGIPQTEIDDALCTANNIVCRGRNNFCPRFSDFVIRVIGLHAQGRSESQILKRRHE